MPGKIKSVSFSSPYDSEQAEIDRRRKMAELLQAQGAQGTGGTEMIGGWAIPKSPLEGLGKAAQQVAGAYQGKQADEMAKALRERQQGDYASDRSALVAALQGTPAAPGVDDPAAGQYAPPTAAQAPNPQALQGMNFRSPMFQQMQAQMLAQQLQQDSQRRGFMAAGGMGQPAPSAGAAPAVQIGGTGQTPQGQNSGFGGPAGGQPMAVWMQLDPTGKAYTEQLAKDYGEANKPQNVRPQGTIAVPDGKGGYRQAYYSPAVGEGMTRGPEGGATPIQGYVEGQTELGKTPMQEVTNADGTKSYIPKAQLSRAAGAPTPPQAPRAPVPVGFPRESPTQLRGAGTDALRILEAEAAKFSAQGQPVPAELQREISNAQKMAGGAYPRSANPVPVSGGLGGAPRFGQTEAEKVTQERQTSAGKAVDEVFAKDYVAFTTGGAQDATKQISQLADVRRALTSEGADLTGPIRGSAPDWAQKWTATGRKAIAMRERVEEVVQRSLRAILGAQFTEKEGERLIARAYNPNLTESENAVRVGRLMTQLEQALQNKTDAANYFQKNNTLQGWKGKLPSISDFDPDAGGGKPNAQDTAALEWATANPNDPRAAAIKQRLGVR